MPKTYRPRITLRYAIGRSYLNGEIVNAFMIFPYYAQETKYTCGAASMRMALASLGIKKSEKEVARLCKSSPHHGTWYKDLVSTAKKLKLKYIVKSDATVVEVKELLAQNYKIIVCYFELKENSDHYAMIKNIDKKHIYFWDPWYGAYHKYTISHFRTIWRSRERPDKADRWFIAIKK